MLICLLYQLHNLLIIQKTLLLSLLLLTACSGKHKDIALLFTGDLLLDRGVRYKIEHSGADALFEEVAPLFQKADFTIANLECPVTDTASPINKRYIFRAEPEWLEAVKKAGITHLVLANNHANDQGLRGLSATARHIRAQQIVPVGYGEKQTAACTPVILQKNGLRIVLFASVQVPLENWPVLPEEAGICQAGSSNMVRRIGEWRSQNPNDKIVVILHWGVEFASRPEPWQVREAKALIDAGADAVIGHHPHIVQSVNWYKGKPIAYSLGNFIFDQRQPEASKGMIAGLRFTEDSLFFESYPIQIINCIPRLVK